MIRLRLRTAVAAFNHAASEYALARLEIAAAHPRIVAPPVIDRLGVNARADDEGRVWRVALRQIRTAESYVRTGASAVARRHGAWSKLIAAFAFVKQFAISIETLRTANVRPGRKRPS